MLQSDKRLPTYNEKIVASKFDLLLTVIIFIFVFLRIYNFCNLPNGINQDEAMNAVDALSLSKYATDRFGTFLPVHLTGWEVGQQSCLISYLQVPFIWLFGFNIFAIRLPSVVLGLIGCFSIYKIVKELFNNIVYAKIALILALSYPMLFLASRWSLDANLLSHFFVIGFLFLICGFKKKKYIYLSMIFFSLCMYAYAVSFYCVPMFLLFSAICLLQHKKISIKDLLICIFIYFSLSWPIYLTMFVNFMGWNTINLPFMTIPSFPLSVRAQDIVFFSDTPFVDLLNNFSFFVCMFFFQNTNLLLNNHILLIPFLIAGIIYIFMQCRKDSLFYKLIFCWFVSCFILGMTISCNSFSRINIIYYLNVILTIIGIKCVYEVFLKNNFCNTKHYISVIFLLIFIQSLVFLSNYFTFYSNPSFHADFCNAVSYATKINPDYFYIEAIGFGTPKTTQGISTGEILTMYTQEMDSKYYIGETNYFLDKNIPYKERYTFMSNSYEIILKKENAVYIVKDSRLNFFDNTYDIKQFGKYYVVQKAAS